MLSGTDRKSYRPLHGEALKDRDQKVLRLLESGTDYKDIAREMNITTARVSQIKTAANSGRSRLMLALQAEAGDDRRVARPLPEITKPLGLGTHEAKHLVMKSLARAGLVTFVEGGNNGDKTPFKELRLTERGLKWRPPATVTPLPAPKPTRELDTTHFVGDDCPGGHSWFKHEPETAETAPETPETAPEPVSEPVTVSWELETASEVAETPETAPEPSFQTKYPYIALLISRKTELEAAAKVLEAHGLDDLATEALIAAEPKDGLEREILRYLDDQG